MIIFDVIPVSKPRMSQRDKWMERDATAAYWAYKEELGYKAKLKKFILGTCIDMIFVLPFKKTHSESKRKEIDGKVHQEKPDIDNLVKGFFDALTTDDSKIWHVSARKFWGDHGAVVILRNEVMTQHFNIQDYHRNQTT